MRSTLVKIVAGLGLLGLATPVMAADPLRVIHEAPPGSGVWNNAFPGKAPESDEQRAANGAEQMAQQLRRNEGAVHPGEDSLGTGTSITH